jgi:hypothetical protein
MSQGEIQRSGIGMAKVKIAIRGRGKTENTVGKGPGHILKLQAGLIKPGRASPGKGRRLSSLLTEMPGGIPYPCKRNSPDGYRGAAQLHWTPGTESWRSATSL